MCLWELIYAKSGTMGVPIYARGYMCMAKMQLGRGEPSSLHTCDSDR